MVRMQYTAAVANAGESVQGCAANIRAIGEEMYGSLRNLIGSENLSGEIATALEQSHLRWNTACDEFSQAEQQFGVRTVDAYHNMMAADARGAANF